MASKQGQRVYNSTRWRVLRQEILKRDQWTCSKCGRLGGRLEVHHTKQITKANPSDWFNPECLEVLCRSCHIEISRAERKRPVTPERRKFMEMANG